jgi:hypothetical protein
MVWTLRARIVLLLIPGFSTFFEHEHEDPPPRGATAGQATTRTRAVLHFQDWLSVMALTSGDGLALEDLLHIARRGRGRPRCARLN